MPFETGGIGPGIGLTAYPVVGPPFRRSTMHSVGHEASHPIAKNTIAPIREEIGKRAYLLERAKADANYPNCYNHWPTCFEEHLIRAMQRGFIDPRYDGSDVRIRLSQERRRNGMIFIDDFYKEIARHKKKPHGTLTGVALRILERLDEKYGR